MVKSSHKKQQEELLVPREEREAGDGVRGGGVLASSNRDTLFSVIRVNGVRSPQLSVCG